MASKNIDQVYIANPITSNIGTDLMYFGRSPYGITDDTAMTFTNFAAQFLPAGGIVSPTNGGTGVSNPTAHGVMIAEGASPMVPIVLLSGQILIGSTGNDPVAAAINSGTSVLVANGAGSITVGLAVIASHDILSNITGGAAAPIANTLTATIDAAIGSTQGDILYRDAGAWVALAPSTSGFFLKTQGAAANPVWSALPSSSIPWTRKGISFSAVASNGYFISALSTATLPNAPADGTTISFANASSATFTIQAQGSDVIQFGSVKSSVAGTIVSSTIGDAVTLVYDLTDNLWIAISSIGAWLPA